jgi:hypothetical protein
MSFIDIVQLNTRSDSTLQMYGFANTERFACRSEWLMHRTAASLIPDSIRFIHELICKQPVLLG